MPEVVAALVAAFERGRAQVELQTRDPGGARGILDTTLQRVTGPDGPLVVALGRDVTERRRLEGRLLPDLPVVTMSAAHFEQLVMNLADRGLYLVAES